MEQAAVDSLMVDVRNRLGYHPAIGDQALRYGQNRAAAIEFSHMLIQNAPTTSRELSLALTAVQDALMWANAAIACNETEAEPVASFPFTPVPGPPNPPHPPGYRPVG